MRNLSYQIKHKNTNSGPATNKEFRVNLLWTPRFSLCGALCLRLTTCGCEGVNRVFLYHTQRRGVGGCVHDNGGRTVFVSGERGRRCQWASFHRSVHVFLCWLPSPHTLTLMSLQNYLCHEDYLLHTGENIHHQTSLTKQWIYCWSVLLNIKQWLVCQCCSVNVQICNGVWWEQFGYNISQNSIWGEQETQSPEEPQWNIR